MKNEARTSREVVRWWLGTGLPVVLIVVSALVAAGAWGVPRVLRRLPPEVRRAGADVARRFREGAWASRDEAAVAEADASVERDSAHSPRQEEACRRFLACEEAIAARREALVRANARRSPFLDAAVAATRAYREKAAACEKITKNPQAFSDDERRRAMYDMSRLRLAAQEANERHREWKAAHAAELEKLEDDAEYRRLRAEQRACAAQVPGLVVPQDR